MPESLLHNHLSLLPPGRAWLPPTLPSSYIWKLFRLGDWLPLHGLIPATAHRRRLHTTTFLPEAVWEMLGVYLCVCVLGF